MANRLLNGLSSEKVRWAQNIQDLKDTAYLIVGDVVLVTAFVSYTGYFSMPYRLNMMNEKWKPYLTQLAVNNNWGGGGVWEGVRFSLL